MHLQVHLKSRPLVSVAAVRIEDAQRLWQPETLYLNTASYGLPPTPAWDALQTVLADPERIRGLLGVHGVGHR